MRSSDSLFVLGDFHGDGGAYFQRRCRVVLVFRKGVDGVVALGQIVELVAAGVVGAEILAVDGVAAVKQIDALSLSPVLVVQFREVRVPVFNPNTANDC